MFNFIKKRKVKREAEEKLDKQIEELISIELEKAKNCQTAEVSALYIENAQRLSNMIEDRNRNSITKEKNLVDKIGIVAGIATTGLNIGAQAMAINHADKLNTMGVIDTTEYGRSIKRNLFLPDKH